MLWLTLFFSLFPATPTHADPVMPKMTPELFPPVMEQHEVVVRVTPERASGTGKDFRVFCAFLVKAPMDATRKALLDFASYRSFSSALDEVRFEPRRRLLWISGSVLTLRFSSYVKIEEHSPQWIHFAALLDKHRSMPADLFLKPVALSGHENETLVYLSGVSHVDSVLIPDMTIRKAAELMVTSAAEKIRKRTESPGK